MQGDGEYMGFHSPGGLHLHLAMLDLQHLVHPDQWRYLRNFNSGFFSF